MLRLETAIYSLLTITLLMSCCLRPNSQTKGMSYTKKPSAGCVLVQPTLFPLAAERGSWRRLLSSAPVPAGPSHCPVPAPHQGVTLSHRKPRPCTAVCDTWCLFGEVEGYDGERSGWGGMWGGRGGGEAVTRRGAWCQLGSRVVTNLGGEHQSTLLRAPTSHSSSFTTPDKDGSPAAAVKK